MITNEHDLGDALRSVPSPPDLQLDVDQVLTSVQRVDRRRRTRRGITAGLAAAAVGVCALWGTGITPGPLGVLPAAPWLSACQGITTGEDGTTQINLDSVSYAEVPVTVWPSAPEGETVVALDTCSEDVSRVAFALLGETGRLTHVEAPAQYAADDLAALQHGERLQPGLVTLSERDTLHFGVVGADVTDLRFLSRGASPEVQREPLPGTALEAYAAHAGADLAQTLGVAWTDPSGTGHVQWLHVHDVVTFDSDPGEEVPLVAQALQGSWNLWLPGATEEHGHAEVGDLGGSIGAEHDDGTYEHLALLRDGVDLAVETPADSPPAVVRHGESSDGETRFAWAKVPPGSTLFEVDAQGNRLDTLTPSARP
ncbi:hypothetical protein NF556_05500 [Ornithinimicrobium faecis]|uniref:Uncharacterized protein n=1 Tax=Ornithinimicrobium faecis TaxID=2934158 RepID=A0ABY4YWF2_9MICO|nr:hypothetical protein [Ornithinimicrobium sp. HY1793]USQ81101.1 hypothetical protein NF556_05500 [Ornithinimicrobium sp. HY1793]